MYYTESIQLHQAKELFEKCGLSMPVGIDYTVGVFDDGGRLAATGSLNGDMIQGIAVDPAFQGEDLMGKVLTHLIQQASDSQVLYLFTKPEKVMQFLGLGFRLVAKARPYAALLEWGQTRVKDYQAALSAVAASREEKIGDVGALVMNCNPFTKGHRYLIETAANACSHVYVLVVEEDLSRFPFSHRLDLVKKGTADLQNVTVISGGRYAVSSLTFPSYFTKEEKVAAAHAAMDAELFATVIGPALGVTKRFIGTEPLSPVTDIYNQTLKSRLPKAGISVEEVPRLEISDEVVSASRIRALIDEGGDDAWRQIGELVPETTFDYLEANAKKVTLRELLEAREKRSIHQKELLEKFDSILVSMTLNIPGAVKDKPLYRKALETGMERMKEKLSSDAIHFAETRHLFTGSEGYLCVDYHMLDGIAVKKAALKIEEEDAFGRLLDIDVMSKEQTFSRAQLGVPPRKCLLCDKDAKICARSQRHEMKELLKRIDEILTVGR